MKCFAPKISLGFVIAATSMGGACQMSDTLAPTGAGGKDDYYGDDSRLDLADIPESSPIRTWARATAIWVDATGMSCDATADECTLRSITLRESLSVCDGQAFADQPTVYGCSAFLVGPDLVATAGHCAQTFTCSGTRFVFGYAVDGSGDPPEKVPARDVIPCTEVVAMHATTTTDPGNGGSAPDKDFLIARLARPVDVGKHPPLRLRREGAVELGENMIILGHPSGLPLKVSDGPVVDMPPERNYLVCETDTADRSSGSVVMNAGAGRVEGIHVWGDRRVAYRPIDEMATCFVLDNTCGAVDRSNLDCRGNLVTRADLFAPFVPTCEKRCGGWFTLPTHVVPECYCDEGCSERGACCWDFEDFCGPT